MGYFHFEGGVQVWGSGGKGWLGVAMGMEPFVFMQQPCTQRSTIGSSPGTSLGLSPGPSPGPSLALAMATNMGHYYYDNNNN